MNEKIIFFTKAPRRGFGKSRLKILSEEQRLELSIQLIKENDSIARKSNFPRVIYYDGKVEDLSFLSGEMKKQEGSGLGERMYRSLKEELLESDKVILMGSDLEGISVEMIEEAFQALEKKDIVLTPTKDGGFGLIGMKKAYDLFSDIEYSRGDVFQNTVKKIQDLGLSSHLLLEIMDVDVIEDLIALEMKAKKVQLLGQGEYNINFLCDDSYVLRINLGSQLHLGEGQIPYEYHALQLLQPSQVVPKVYEYKMRGKYLPLPFLTMEYIEGRPLDYDVDLKTAAYLLSQIHQLNGEGSTLITADRPFEEMFKECKRMFQKYRNWEKKEKVTVEYIEKFMKIAESLGLEDPIEGYSIINTELNNRNFILGEKNVVIDWEKPIIGECEQDLAHFLVPTTTNWKTDKILSADERQEFLSEYKKFHPVDDKKLGKYLVFNCLRGVSWCSMAKIEYSSGTKSIENRDTLEKIDQFLSPEFLKFIDRNYYEEYHGNIEKE